MRDLLGFAPVVASGGQDVAQGGNRSGYRLHFFRADIATSARDTIDRLQQLEIGGACPDDLGNRVVVYAVATDQIYHCFARQSRHRPLPITGGAHSAMAGHYHGRYISTRIKNKSPVLANLARGRRERASSSPCQLPTAANRGLDAC